MVVRHSTFIHGTNQEGASKPRPAGGIESPPPGGVEKPSFRGVEPPPYAVGGPSSSGARNTYVEPSTEPRPCTTCGHPCYGTLAGYFTHVSKWLTI